MSYLFQRNSTTGNEDIFSRVLKIITVYNADLFAQEIYTSYVKDFIQFGSQM